MVATLALAATGDLTLYIHPRYVVFTVLLSLVGAALCGAALWFTAVGRDGAGGASGSHEGGSRDDGHAHAHDGAHEHAPASSSRSRRVLSAGSVGALVIVAAVALLVAPPSALSTERALASGSSTEGGAEAPPPSLVGSDPTRFSVRDWATILGSGATAADLVGQQADVTGFVLVDDDGVRVGRYAVTCCTVDAQLFAVPIATADLPAELQSGDWVHLTGTFTDDDGATHLSPDTVDVVEEPDDPYLS